MTSAKGFAAICDASDRIVAVLRDDLALGLRRSAELRDIVDPADYTKYAGFLADIHSRQASFDWPINVLAGTTVTTLHFAAAVIDEQTVVLGAPNRRELAKLSEELASGALSVPGGMRSVLQESARLLDQQSVQDGRLYDELTRLNNELASTERRQIKANLRLAQANEELRLFYDALPLGVFRTDRAGTVVQCNASFRRWSGAARRGPWYAGLHADGRRSVERHWQVLLDAGVPFDRIDRFLGQDGQERQLLVRIVPLGSDAEPASIYLGVVEDVTARERANREARDLARHRAIHDVTAGLAHHLNNIMAVTLGTADELAAELPADHHLRESALLNLQSAQRAAELTHHLMIYSGVAFISDEPIAIANAVAARLAVLDAERRRRFELFDSEENAVVQVDRAALDAALDALIDNASRAIAGQADGRVAVHIRRMMDDSRAPRPLIAIEIADNGCGMDKSTLAQARDPFFTTREGALGLGLSFADGFARSCDGLLEIESTPARGTHARLLLPTVESGLEARP